MSIFLALFAFYSSPFYTLISAKDQFGHLTNRVNQLWQTDFTYLKVIDWGWYDLLTVLDNDYSQAELEARASEWVDHYNNERYHEAIDNVTPSDRFFGRDKKILEQRKKQRLCVREEKYIAYL